MAAYDSSPQVAKVCSSLFGTLFATINTWSKFIRMILLVMIDSPRLSELVATIQALPEPTQQIVGTLMHEMVDWDPESNTELDEGIHIGATHESSPKGTFSPSPGPRTDILQLEEQYAKIMSQLERRNMEYADLETEFEALSNSLARSQETNVSASNPVPDKADTS